jgi:ferredoxin
MSTFRVTFQPAGKTINVEAGKSLYEAAEDAGVQIDSACGGQGICGMCKVRVTAGSAEVTEAEDNHLSSDDIKAGLRLACQFRIGSDVTCSLIE